MSWCLLCPMAVIRVDDDDDDDGGGGDDDNYGGGDGMTATATRTSLNNRF